MIHLFPEGQVEVGTGGPGYRWVPAYCQANADGGISQPLTRRHWQAIAKRDGEKCKFHADRSDAIMASKRHSGAGREEHDPGKRNKNGTQGKDVSG